MSAAERARCEEIISRHLRAGTVAPAMQRELEAAGYMLIDTERASGGIARVSYLCPSGDPETSRISAP